VIAGPSNGVGGFNVPNTIAFNGGPGVRVEYGWGNEITGNRMFDNGGLGIELEPTGTDANDPGDPDDGPNRHQNHPVLTKAEAGDGQSVFTGTLNSRPNATFTIHIYRNDACDPSGFGEGRDLVATKSVTTDASGNGGFTTTINSELPEGTQLTTTATGTGGQVSPTDTSEFSRCFASTRVQAP
jgi:parallel beta-helix repeat protein